MACQSFHCKPWFSRFLTPLVLNRCRHCTHAADLDKFSVFQKEKPEGKTLLKLLNVLSTGSQSLQTPFFFSRIHVKQDSVTQDRFCQQILPSLESPGMPQCPAPREGQWLGHTLGSTKQKPRMREVALRSLWSSQIFNCSMDYRLPRHNLVFLEAYLSLGSLHKQTAALSLMWVPFHWHVTFRGVLPTFRDAGTLSEEELMP